MNTKPNVLAPPYANTIWLSVSVVLTDTSLPLFNSCLFLSTVGMKDDIICLQHGRPFLGKSVTNTAQDALPEGHFQE